MNTLNHITPQSVRAWEYLFTDFLGSGYVMATCNATMSLVGVMHALSLQGKRVIVSPLTYPGAVTALMALGCQIVWCDVDPVTYGLDPKALQSVINNRVAAVLTTDYLGYPVALDKIANTCRDHRVVLIHDAACSLGSMYRGRFSGYYADLVVFSFGRMKLISAEAGGAIWAKRRGTYRHLCRTLIHPDEQLMRGKSVNPFVLNIEMPASVAHDLTITWEKQISSMNERRNKLIQNKAVAQAIPQNTTPNFFRVIVDEQLSRDLGQPLTTHVPLNTKDADGRAAGKACPVAKAILSHKKILAL